MEFITVAPFMLLLINGIPALHTFFTLCSIMDQSPDQMEFAEIYLTYESDLDLSDFVYMSNEGGDAGDPSNSNGGPNPPAGGPSEPNNNGNNPDNGVPPTNNSDNEEDSDTDMEDSEEIESGDEDYKRMDELEDLLNTTNNPTNNIYRSAERLDNGETLSPEDDEKFNKITELKSGPYKEALQNRVRNSEKELDDVRARVAYKESNRTDKEDFEAYYDDKDGKNNK